MRRLSAVIIWMMGNFGMNAFSQTSFFSKADESALFRTPKKVEAEKYFASSLQAKGVELFLQNLPAEQHVNRKQAPVVSLPMPDGKMAKFRLWKYAMLEPELASRYPEIQTCMGYGVDDPYASLRIDYNPYTGLHAQILSIKGDVYIEPFSETERNLYVSYYGNDYLRRVPAFTCSSVPDEANRPDSSQLTEAGTCRGTQLFTYRLALACTGEYATAVCAPSAPTVAVTLAAMVTTINRVNGIYEKELAMRFLLVANNNLVVYTNAATDPFTNGNELVMLNENQATLNSVIGAANYDAGMVLGTGNANAAASFAVCNNINKGKAVTSLAGPTGDMFDVGRVAHNLGHLFHAADTHNSNDATCSPHPPAVSGYEPGAGTTIMAAAGSCGNDNLQPMPDPYFHAVSFNQITNFITAPVLGCHGIINTGNTPPRFTNNVIYGANIPMNTPFEIRGIAYTDDDGDPVTISYDEVDRGPAGAWNSAATSEAPAFRSKLPQTMAERTFPDIRLIAAGYPANPPVAQGGLKGETLSTISRGYSFAVTLRDGRGGVMNADNNCSSTTFGYFNVYAVPGTGPFKVNLPDGGETWSALSQQTILWDVAGSTGPMINTQLVNIRLSTDGGLTYPFFLASGVPNDGFEVVTMPNITSSTARIRVEGFNNIFFDISNADFSIASAPVGFEFGNPALQTLSCPAPASVTYLLGTVSNGSYAIPVILSATGVPAGATVSFSTNPVQPGNSSTVLVSNVNTLSQGLYYITITGTSGITTRTRVLVLNVQTGASPVITTQPVSQTDCQGATVTFSITSPSAIAYQWQLSTDGGFTFSNIIAGGDQSTLSIANISGQEFNRRYRCIVSGQCNSTVSSVVQINVLPAPFIRTQPRNIAVCAGTTATMQIEIAGSFPAYQWQVNNGSGYINISGATSNVLTLAAVTTSMNNNLYRCLVFNPGCTTPAISDVATLTVNQLPTVSLSASPYTKLLPGLETTITATALGSSPFTYRWYIDGVHLGSIIANSYRAGIDRLGNYRVDVTDVRGCIGQSALLNIGDSASNKFFIFPNPNNGMFAITLYNSGGATSERQVTVYNSVGQKILFDKAIVSGAYQLLYYDISPAARGIYLVVLSDGTGKVLAKGKMMVQ